MKTETGRGSKLLRGSSIGLLVTVFLFLHWTDVSPTHLDVLSAEADNSAISATHKYLDAVSSDGRYIAVTDTGSPLFSSQTLTIWDVSTCKPVSTISGHNDQFPITASGLGGDSTAFIIDGSKVFIWDWRKQKYLLTLQMPEHVSGKLSPDKKTFVFCKWWEKNVAIPGLVEFWDAEKGIKLSTLPGLSLGLPISEFTTDGKRVLLVDLGGTVRIVDSDKRTPVIEFKQDCIPHSISMSPDQTAIVLAGCGRDGKDALVVSSSSGEVKKILKGHSTVVLAAIHTDDGREVITADKSGTICFWSSSTLEPLFCLQEEDDGLWLSVVLKVLSDKKTLFVGRTLYKSSAGQNSWDYTPRASFWDLGKKRCLRKLQLTDVLNEFDCSTNAPVKTLTEGFRSIVPEKSK